MMSSWLSSMTVGAVEAAATGGRPLLATLAAGKRKERVNHEDEKRVKKQSNLTRHHCLMALAIFSTIQLLLPQAVVCQDLEDLNKQQPATIGSQQQLSPHQYTFQQPINSRQPQQQQQSAAASSSSSSQNTRHSMQRPILSSRFAASATGSSSGLSAQASSGAPIFSSPNSVPAAVAAAQQQQPAGAGGMSNIEQLMKNALARTAQMNSAAAEPRQDSIVAAPVEPTQQKQQPQQQQQQQPIASQQPSSIGVSSRSSSPATADKTADSSEFAAETLPVNSADDSEKQTTVAQTTTTNGHETVYTDQRFANLFARRPGAKRSRLTPTEQVKAKPTLPSFIKSPPDPKQFAATQAVSGSQDRPPATPASAFASQRLQQQQNQGRISLANQQAKKAVITSNSAAIANNKRANSALLNNAKLPNSSASTASPKASIAKAAASGASAGKPAAAASVPSGNNPFSRPQGSSSDPANVIAMARKRLLANNALETAKLKQQQQNKPTVN